MIRQKYFNLIEIKLTELATSIALRGKVNILDKNLFAENFYLEFCNLLFGWNLKNLNAANQNAAAVDLIDDQLKIVVQVSATATKEKVQSALKKDLAKYVAYTLFADAEGIPCFHFLLTDKKELMHDNQLLAIARLVNQKGIQFVASILKDKLPPELDDEKLIVLKLSQTNKLFNIERS